MADTDLVPVREERPAIAGLIESKEALALRASDLSLGEIQEEMRRIYEDADRQGIIFKLRLATQRFGVKQADGLYWDFEANGIAITSRVYITNQAVVTAKGIVVMQDAPIEARKFIPGEWLYVFAQQVRKAQDAGAETRRVSENSEREKIALDLFASI